MSFAESDVELAKLATLSTESLENRQGDRLQVHDYVAAARACKGKHDVEVIWNEILELQKREDFKSCPSPFVCVVNSSGTGKTQLAATTAILKDDYRVLYFYTGNASADMIQRFYRPYANLWSRLKTLLNDFCTKFKSEGGNDLPGASAIYDYNEGHPLLQFFNNVLFDTNESTTVQSLRNRFRVEKQANTIVFLDEVPPKARYRDAIMLRDFLRAIGVVPVLMSTHIGAHNAIGRGNDSRDDHEVPNLWCRVVVKLPANHGFQSKGYAFKTERPLVCNMVSTLPDQASLKDCVQEVRNKFRNAKRNAWDRCSLFQLCQLFRSSKHIEELTTS